MAETYDIIVVGAGISGLRAASELQNAYGFSKVKVLEARGKVGGRVQQDHTFLPGRTLELGAEFIHGDINPIVELCEANGWARRHIFTWSHGDGGPAEGPAPDGGVGYYWIGAERKLYRYDDEDVDMKRCNEALWNLQHVEKDAAEADRRSLKQYLADEGVPERMIPLACAGYGNTAGGTADTVPASRAMRFERAWHGDGSELDPDFRMEPSFGVLISHLSQGLDIEINSPVQSVTVDTALLEKQKREAAAAAAGLVNGGQDPVFSDAQGDYPQLDAAPLPSAPACTVTTKDGRVYHAHRVLVTAPLPILKAREIAFNPPLSAEKSAAIDSMSFANGVKVVLKFNRRAWPRNCHGVVCADSFIPEMWMNSSKGVGGLIEGITCQYASASVEGSQAGGSEAEDVTNPTSGNTCVACNINTGTEASSVADGTSSLHSSCVKCGNPLENDAATATFTASGALASPSPTNSAASTNKFEDEPAAEDETGMLFTVTAFIMGVRADEILKNNSHPVILAKILSQLDAMFDKDAAGSFIDGFVHSWAEEPYIRGAYSTPTWKELEQPDNVIQLAKPHCEAVFFAGEATAGAVDGTQRDHPANRLHFAPPIVLHGAMQTGSAAACDIARSLGIPITCTNDCHAFMPTYRHIGEDAAAHMPIPAAPPAVPCKTSGHAHAHLEVNLDIPLKTGGTSPASQSSTRTLTPCTAVKKGYATVRHSTRSATTTASTSTSSDVKVALTSCAQEGDIHVIGRNQVVGQVFTFDGQQ